MDTETSVQPETVGFESLGLSESLVKNLKDLGFSSPTPIQTATIPILLESNTDFVGLASTGTGKTAAFGLPLVEKISADVKKPQALVLCPTRELAMQVSGQIQNFARVKGLVVATVYGGAAYGPQLASIKRGAQIVVATPGRLIDLLDRKHIDLSEVKNVVLDEADEMVSLGFKDDLETILKATDKAGSDRKTWLFSATMSPPVRRIAQTYLKDPKSAEIQKNSGTVSTIQQIYYGVRTRDKAEVLLRVLQTENKFYGLIFCQTRRDTADVARYLNENGYAAEALHGDKSQADREKILDLLRRGKLRAVVATDVAARGIDVKELTHVINFSLPREVDSYIHRIGRTGRNGQQGIALSFVAPEEIRMLHRIQQVTKVTVEQKEIPTAKNLVGYKLGSIQEKLITTLADTKSFERAKALFGDQELPETLANLSPKDFLCLLISSHYPETLAAREFEKINFTQNGRSHGGRDRSYGARENREERSGGRFSNSRPRRFDRSDEPPRYSADDSSGPRNESSSFAPRAERPDRTPRTGDRTERAPRFSRDRDDSRPARSESGFSKPAYERRERPSDDTRPARADSKSYERRERPSDDTRPARSASDRPAYARATEDRPVRRFARPDGAASAPAFGARKRFSDDSRPSRPAGDRPFTRSADGSGAPRKPRSETGRSAIRSEAFKSRADRGSDSRPSRF